MGTKGDAGTGYPAWTQALRGDVGIPGQCRDQNLLGMWALRGDVGTQADAGTGYPAWMVGTQE